MLSDPLAYALPKNQCLKNPERKFLTRSVGLDQLSEPANQIRGEAPPVRLTEPCDLPMCLMSISPRNLFS